MMTTTKTAGLLPGPGATPPVSAIDLKYQDAVRKLLHSGLAVSGGIAGGMGLMGLYNTLTAPRGAGTTQLPGRHEDATMSFPHMQQEEEEKVAEDDGGVAGAAKAITGLMPEGLKFDVNHAWQHPLGLPVAAGVLGGAGYGTYRLMNWLAENRRKAALQSKLDNAKKQYDAALSSQFASGKTAAATGDGLGLDDLAEKQAFLGSYGKDIKSWGGAGLGAYLTALGVLTGGAGAVTYDWAKSRSKRKAIERQMAEEQRRRRLQQPEPLFATVA